MGWSDRWTVHLDAGMTALTVTTAPTPPVSTGWLGMRSTAGFCGGNLLRTSGAGVLAGQLRTLIQVNNPSLSGDAGVYCLASQASQRPDGGGQAYGLRFHQHQSSGTKRRIDFVKFADGCKDADIVQFLAQTADGTWTNNTLYAVQLQFDARTATVAELGGPIFSVSIGAAIDYSDLAPLTGFQDIVDLTSPLTTSVAEGPWAYTNNSDNFNAYFDQTTLIPAL